MELRSTAIFKDIDIDAMVETTNLDDFMANVFKARDEKTGTAKQPQSEFDQIMSQLRTKEEPTDLKLEFETPAQ